MFPKKMHSKKKKLTKEKKYKNLKKEDQHSRNKTPKAKVHQTLDLPGKNTKKMRI